MLRGPSKLRNEKHKKYFTDIMYNMIVKTKSLNNYKSYLKSFKTKKTGTQKIFPGHYIIENHEGNKVK